MSVMSSWFQWERVVHSLVSSRCVRVSWAVSGSNLCSVLIRESSAAVICLQPCCSEVRVCVCERLLVRLRSCGDWSGLEVKGQINTAGTLLLAGLALFLFFPLPSLHLLAVVYLCQAYFISRLSPFWSFVLPPSLLSFALVNVFSLSACSHFPCLILSLFLTFYLIFSSLLWLFLLLFVLYLVCHQSILIFCHFCLAALCSDVPMWLSIPFFFYSSPHLSPCPFMEECSHHVQIHHFSLVFLSCFLRLVSLCVAKSLHEYVGAEHLIKNQQVLFLIFLFQRPAPIQHDQCQLLMLDKKSLAHSSGFRDLRSGLSVDQLVLPLCTGVGLCMGRPPSNMCCERVFGTVRFSTDRHLCEQKEASTSKMCITYISYCCC